MKGPTDHRHSSSPHSSSRHSSSPRGRQEFPVASTGRPSTGRHATGRHPHPCVPSSLASLALWLIASVASADVLLLHNGNVLSGQVTRQPTRWQIELDGGGKVSVNAAAVRFHGPDVESAYQHQRRTVRPNDGVGLAKLIDWSLRQGLYEHARRDLDQLQRTDPNNARRVTLERRWQESSQAAAAPESQHAPRLAQPVEESTTADLQGSSRAELRLSGLTAEQLVEFSRQAYPVLHQRCSGGGCHSAVAGNLDRPFRIYDRQALIGAMRRNLAAASKFVDTQQPSESPLLRYAQQAHGTRSTPPLDESDQRALERLKSWVTVFAASMATPAGTGAPGQATTVDGQVTAASATDPLDPAAFNRVTTAAAATAADHTDTDNDNDNGNTDSDESDNDNADKPPAIDESVPADVSEDESEDESDLREPVVRR
ncbi:MAG: hypothetical protein U0795_03595 [Pirellulales bacterium]